jgi:hypothetical protein
LLGQYWRLLSAVSDVSVGSGACRPSSLPPRSRATRQLPGRHPCQHTFAPPICGAFSNSGDWWRDGRWWPRSSQGRAPGGSGPELRWSQGLGLTAAIDERCRPVQHANSPSVNVPSSRPSAQQMSPVSVSAVQTEAGARTGGGGGGSTVPRCGTRVGSAAADTGGRG